MNTLWPIGEATVREIRERLADRLPRAYTTIMTIMDRLTHKGVVERRKAGRAYVYRANLSAEEARAQAVAQIVKNYFGGSEEALLTQLAARTAPPLARAAAAGAVSGPGPVMGAVRNPAPAPVSDPTRPGDKTAL
jgi:predicted transcriptional regulator